LTNVLGGTVTDTVGHHNTTHAINYFGDIIAVNSYHTLAITQLHKSGTVLATDEDGNCEAWIDGQTAGVVWHPERMKEPWIPDEIKTLLFKD
jgi:gamma-glutamyl-gamma-aminobutyrate hydrolase PuuD